MTSPLESIWLKSIDGTMKKDIASDCEENGFEIISKVMELLYETKVSHIHV